MKIKKEERKKKKARYVFILLFSFFTFHFSFAQENIQIEIQPRFVQRFSWTPSDYALHYEIEIEKEEEGVYNRFLWEKTENSFVHIALPNGNYRFRVIPYDLLNRPGIISEYQYIEIKQAPPQVSQQTGMQTYEEIPDEEKPFFPPTGGFFGLSPEINAYTRSGFAIGGGLTFGMDLVLNLQDKQTQYFSAGLRSSFFFNLDSISSIEFLILLRYYLPFEILHWPKEKDGPFVQAELGAVVFMESGYFTYREAVPSVAGGFAVGWHFNLSRYWFIDPTVRFGYPYMWGVNVTAGIKF